MAVLDSPDNDTTCGNKIPSKCSLGKLENDINSKSSIFGNLRGLINIVDELRDAGVHHYINLPRICVVGTQSAGKSSVLEAIVGIDFLPRGEGIVTRRPLELRLEHVTEGQGEDAWAIFEQDKSKKKYYNFEEVRREIERVTDEVAGKNKGIVDDPIILSISGKNCPDLTLVDLPGITRVPLRGSDQTDEIERLTRDMASRYANDPRTIILAVVPANQDISTSDALQLARKVDPRGLRTIGVITKIDLMDKGTNAARMVVGDDVPLRLGYVAVKNRSQADILSKKPIPEALEEEREYFRKHSVYKTMSPQMFGVLSLVDKLTKVLFKHIRNFLPEIKEEINQKMGWLRTRTSELGDGVPSESTERTQLMWTLINDFCETFRNTIRGKYERRLSSHFDPTTDFAGGAHVRMQFNELLEPMVDKSVTQNMSDFDIDNAMRLHEGDSLPGFPSPDTFEYLILPHLKTIHGPVFDLLDRIAQTLEVLMHKVSGRVFCRFPNLASQILELSQNILIREKDHTRTILEYVVTAETSYLFTNDSTYLTEHGSMIPNNKDEKGQTPVAQAKETDASSQTHSSINNWGLPFSRQNQIPDANAGVIGTIKSSAQTMWGGERRTRYSAAFLAEIRRRLDAYFAIVVRNIRDTVPKVLGFFLVRATQDSLQFELYNQLNKVDRFDSLLGEPVAIREEREALAEQMKTLNKALQILQRDPAITSLCLADPFDEMYDWDLEAEHKQTAGPTLNMPSLFNVPNISPGVLNHNNYQQPIQVNDQTKNLSNQPQWNYQGVNQVMREDPNSRQLPFSSSSASPISSAGLPNLNVNNQQGQQNGHAMSSRLVGLFDNLKSGHSANKAVVNANDPNVILGQAQNNTRKPALNQAPLFRN